MTSQKPLPNKFNGFTGVKSKATGFFRTAKVNGRWWLITPEGYGFIAAGLNHVHPSYLLNGNAGEKWKSLLASENAFNEMAATDLGNWNINAVSNMALGKYAKIPYLIFLKFPITSCNFPQANHPDVFDPSFETQCREIIDLKCGPLKEDPYLIGYNFNDVVDWPLIGKASKRRSLNWVDTLKSRNSQSKGKQQYVRLMQERHRTIESFNAAYASEFSSWQDLSEDDEFVYNVPAKMDVTHDDDRAFLRLLSKRYYEVTYGNIRKTDPNHLILGDRLEGNRGVPPEVIEAAKQHVDVLSIQYYGFFKDQKENLVKWHKQSGLPILLSDSGYSVIQENMPRPCGPRLSSHEERAKAFARYAHQALSQPFIVGWFWYGYVDATAAWSNPRQHMGIKNARGEPYEPLANAMKDTYADPYKIADVINESRNR